MRYIFTQFASTSVENTDLFSSIGVDWRLLVLQILAFLILLAVLKKWVYPPLVTMLDKRDVEVRESAEAAQAAKHAAEAAEENTAKLLKEARAEAANIVATARAEATDVVELAHKKATDKADALLESARDEITKEIEVAKKTLHNETLDLVAEATGTILQTKVTGEVDAKLIARAVKEAQS